MPNIIVSSSIDQFMQSADSAAARSFLGLDIGTGAAQVASGNHTHVEFHDAATVSGNGVSITGQQISLDIGTGAAQVASGNHTHSSFVGDAGAGGLAGFVPAPASGDAAAGKYLDADGTWTVPIVSSAKSPFPTSESIWISNFTLTAEADEQLFILDITNGNVTGLIGEFPSVDATHYWIQAYSETPLGNGYLNRDTNVVLNVPSSPSGNADIELTLGRVYHIYLVSPKVWRVLDTTIVF